MRERRIFKRFKIKYGSTVVAKEPSFLPFLKQRQVKLGCIEDISKGGLSVHYTDRLLSDFDMLTIVNWGGEIKKIENLFVKSLADFTIGKIKGLEIRKRCFKFVNLSGYQKARISYFLHLLAANYIEENVGDQKVYFYHLT